MRKLHIHKLALLGVMGLGLTTASNRALAAMLTIINASFEDPVVAPDTSSLNATGWNVSGEGGVFNPNGPFYGGMLGPVPDGNQIGWSHGATFSQTLGYTLQPNTTYTLSIEVGGLADTASGNWSIYNAGVNYSVSLLAGSTTLASVVPVNPPTGSWITLTAIYSAGSVVPSGNLGISIFGGSGGAGPGATDFSFDDVKLSAVPEPTTMVAGLGALGIVLMAVGARSRRCNVARIEE